MNRFFLFILLFGFLCSVPGGEIFNLADFLASEAKKSNIVTLPDGDVRVRGTVRLGPEYRNLIIQGGKNTRLLSCSLTHLFYLDGCSGITLRNFSIDYDPLPFTQGTITEISGNRCRFKIHDGYPKISRIYLNHHPQFFDGKSRLMKWQKTARANYGTGTRAVTDTIGEFTLLIPQDNLQTGDYVVLNYRPDCAIKIRGLSRDLAFENLTFYSAPGGGIMGRRMAGKIIVRGCRDIRGPLPPGAKEPRLLATCADAFNFASMRKGPVIENCEVEAIGDDSVNLHGSMFPVLKTEKNSFLTIQPYRPTEFKELLRNGDDARILDPESFAIKKTSKIVKAEIIPDIPAAELRKLIPTYQGREYITYRITLKGALPDAGDFVDVPAINCPGFIIRNNYFHNHRARGVRIMANRGIIENNRMEHLENSAISVGPEYAYWREAGWVFDIAIRGNHIRNVCLGGGNALSPGAYTPGAISTFVRKETGAPFFIGNRNLTIENNTVEGSPLAGIYLIATDGATVRGNTLKNVNDVKGLRTGADCGIRYLPEPIGQTACRNIKISDNKEEP